MQNLLYSIMLKKKNIYFNFMNVKTQNVGLKYFYGVFVSHCCIANLLAHSFAGQNWAGLWSSHKAKIKQQWTVLPLGQQFSSSICMMLTNLISCSCRPRFLFLFQLLARGHLPPKDHLCALLLYCMLSFYLFEAKSGESLSHGIPFTLWVSFPMKSHSSEREQGNIQINKYVLIGR